MKHWLSTFGFVSGAILLAGLLAAGTAGAAVVLSFTGTVTDVQAIFTSPPAGISVGNPVSGTVVYTTGGATPVEVGPSERAYLFPPASGHEITITIGTQVWKSDLQGVSLCNEECGGDYLDYTGFSNTTVNFPDNLGSGILALEFIDSDPPYGVLDGHDLPNGPEDIHFAEAGTKMGTVSSSSGSSFWVISFDTQSETVPVRDVTWSEVKALFSRP
ncbi:MAG TPA: hypothetical protein VFE28_00285 [Candidatus Krumholzibacteria bacterium]|nr:hypothetical protein [Candidatus Krumholzibacteria bacterium]